MCSFDHSLNQAESSDVSEFLTFKGVLKFLFTYLFEYQECTQFRVKNEPLAQCQGVFIRSQTA
jgi:hypothetical protein